MLFAFIAQGHPAIVSSHPTTLEITTEPRLTKRGDCIVAVRADFGLRDLPAALKKALSSETGRGILTMRVRGESFTVEGRGSSALTFTDPHEIVVRRSGFVSGRTLMVYSNKAAVDIPRRVVKFLQDPAETVTIEISATP